MIQRKDGGWLFISHAHEDIEQVRKIRNYLEEDGYNPIVFFLKSKTLPWTLNRLIKREIRARKWFVLVDSPASRKSKWVQREVRYAEKQKGKIKLTVDLSKEIIPQLKFIVRRTRVFLSYSHHDHMLAERIAAKMSDNDFQVWQASKNISAGSPYSEVVTAAINDTAQEGFFVTLITDSSKNSVWCEKELEYAIRKNCVIIPIVVYGTQLSPMLEFYLGSIQHLSVHQEPTEAELNHLIDKLIDYQEYLTYD